MCLKLKEKPADTASRQPHISTHHGDETRVKNIILTITKMVTGDLLPLRFVKGEGFRELMAFVEPEYKPPAWQATSTRVEKMYEESAAEWRADCNMPTRWLLPQTPGQLSLLSHITCHFIQDWNLNTTVLQTCSTDKENIADHLKAGAEE